MISNYSDLVQTSLAQVDAQRFLFVFCRAELPEDASAEEKDAFQRGEGGALTPVICVDKTPEEAPDFATLVEESRSTGQDWDMVFVAAMSGRGGMEPSSDEAKQPLTMMVESIRLGHISNYLPLNTRGEAVSLQ
ncbi:ribonucleotide reductase subunit alpha [Marinobacter sp. M216]|uniref:Ribonucleotide reductase subunit alpha n=1 Tax=Marinobacter albus TaxID=3030833 RepID=A0ABT7H8Q9_9GAMM|nr:MULTISPECIES: ribonucleotide reductase subunit alpha [unclassified Marinobacter]MBW7470972.1 ribonucleotide reductase subunit alpha [Marinobacter sp. F4218]MDK9556748.1 ribonucleotide reductase subunit alpha [Marinobacter sp. M216]